MWRCEWGSVCTVVNWAKKARHVGLAERGRRALKR